MNHGIHVYLSRTAANMWGTEITPVRCHLKDFIAAGCRTWEMPANEGVFRKVWLSKADKDKALA